jgi:phosphoribosyl-ATP pyrophosphohydrolase
MYRMVREEKKIMYSEIISLVEEVAKIDVEKLHKAEQSYGNSWKKRGGIGAFMMLARKWDRLEKQVTENSFDVFLAAKKDTRAEGILDDIQDLRRYLMLVEAEIIRGKEKNAEEPELFIEDRCEWKTG